MRAEAVAHLLELLEPLHAFGPARARRMFGAHGVYLGDRFIAIVAGEQPYLKVDGETRAAFEAAGGRPFSYTARGRTQQLGFWTVPPEALEASAALEPWVRLALAAALRAAAPRAARQAGAPPRAAAPRRAR